MNANCRHCRACRRAARELRELRRLISNRLEWIDSELDSMGTYLRNVERMAEAIYGFTGYLEERERERQEESYNVGRATEFLGYLKEPEPEEP